MEERGGSGVVELSGRSVSADTSPYRYRLSSIVPSIKRLSWILQSNISYRNISKHNKAGRQCVSVVRVHFTLCDRRGC